MIDHTLMMNNKSFPCLVGLLTTLLLPAIYGQSDTSRITGTVTDATGAVVPNVTITVKNERTDQTHKATSNNAGAYIVTQLGPSTYKVTTEAAGMGPATYVGVALQVGQERTLNIVLQPATVATEVTVSGGDLAVIDTSSAAIGGNVSGREVAELPINGRQISQLYLMTPGAVNFGAGTFDDVRFNGRSFEENALRYDGIEAGGIITNNPSNIGGEINGVFRLQASMENVQEFRVDASNYPAEFGTGSGGQISIITKSGANALHGGLFEYFRNDALDARNEFDGATPSKLRLNQFGGSVGGPIVKDKIFFYGGMETMKQRTAVPFIENTPSRAVRSARDCAPGEAPSATSVTCINPAIRPLLAAFPIGVTSTSSPFFDRDNVREPGVIDEYSGNIRFDFQVTDKDKIYVRYNRDQGYATLPLNSAGSGTNETIVPQNLVFAYNRAQSATMINEAKFGFNGSKTRVSGLAPVVPGLNLNGVSFALNGVQTLDGTPGYALPTGLLRISTAFNGSAAPYTNHSLSFIDNLTIIRGGHNIKMGVEVRPQQIKNAILGGTTYTFPNVQSFLNAAPSQIAINGNTNDVSPFTGKGGFFDMRQTFYIGYVQDEWKIRPNFTMSYGLRYEYYSPLREQNGKVLWFDVPTGTLIPNYTKDWYTMKTTNFGPRLGFSWSPQKLANKTVFRVGGGYYYGPGLAEGQTQPAQNDRINRTITSGSLLTFPADTQSILSAGINDPNLQFQPRAYLPDYQIPEKILQYSASVEQQLPGNAVLTLAYVGSQGRNLFLRGITNRITGVIMNPTTGAGTVVREFSVVNGTTVTNKFAEIDTKTSGGNDHYNGLQALLNRRFSRGLTLNAQYVWGHSIGNSDGSKDARSSSNNYSFSSEYGDNISDVRQSFNFSMLYELPYGNGKKYGSAANGLVKGLMGGWQFGTMFNARTGLPIDIEIARAAVVYRNNTTGVITTSPVLGAGGVILTTPVVNVPGGGQSRNVARPDLVPGVDPYIHNNGWLYINPAAFSMPAPGTYGNLGRNALRGPGMSQVDLTLSKKFPIKETMNFEFRAECYNILNSAVYQAPGYATVSGAQVRLADASGVIQPGQAYTASAAGGNFGALTSTVSNTVGSGTNRQFQLALRFNF